MLHDLSELKYIRNLKHTVIMDLYRPPHLFDKNVWDDK